MAEQRPLFSIFTPTHDLRHIHRVVKSLLVQSCRDFEWVVGFNGKALPSQFTEILDAIDPPAWFRRQIVPVHMRHREGRVGALKAELCGRCRGDWLVELDHDDALTPDALQVILDYIAVWPANNQPDVLYSDPLRVDASGKPVYFDRQFGWGEPDPKHKTQRSFPVTAASLHDIFYAPDHVRVWRREFYHAVGGHDERLNVCDDHDLLIRSYVAHGRFQHIPKPIYHYHVNGEGTNTYLQRNKEIQVKQAELGDKYRMDLIREWCRRERLQMIELGGSKTQDTTNVLGIALKGADMSLDITKGPLPFPDNSVGLVVANDFLEHIPHCRGNTCLHSPTNCSVALMNEIHRVLAPNGWFLSRTPSTDGRGAFQDPTHCSYWNQNSFWYYTRKAQAAFLEGCTARFIVKRLHTFFPNEWCKENDIPYVEAVLTALKETDTMQPGPNGFWPSV